MTPMIKNWPDITNKIVIRFIEIIAGDLARYGGKLIFLKSKRIGDLKAVGEFNHDSGIPIIKIAIKHPEKEIIYTLTHEYAHFLQWAEDSKVWVKFEDNGYEIGTIFNKESPEAARIKCCEMIISLELDCERRAVDLIYQYHLPANESEYIRRANLVLFKWAYSKKTSEWAKTSDKEFDKLCGLCPDKLLKSYKNIPAKLELEFKNLLS